VEITVGLFLMLFLCAFFCEWLDASLGMGYGTILSPVLIIMGFDPVVAVPAVLLSQAFGGFTASVFHHQLKNVSFSKNSTDLKIVFVITSCGIFTTIIAALIAINLPKVVLKTYIGVLVLIMGVIVLRNRKFSFSWRKIIGVGILSAFNKGLSGGGFGPVVTGGQILAGQKHRGAIGATTLSEAPICIVSFCTYLIGRTILEIKSPVLDIPFAEFTTIMFSPKMFQWELILSLLLGSIFVAPFGAITTRILKEDKLHVVLGLLISVLGIWTLMKTYF